MKSRVLDLSPEKLAIALGGLLVVLGLAAWLLLVSPNRDKASSLDSTIKTEQSTLAKLSGQESAARQAAKKPAVSQTLMTSRALPDVTGMPQLLLQLNRIAVEEHVSLDSVSPATPVPYAGYTAIPLTIQLTGEYFGIQGFMQQLLKQVSANANGVAATGRLYDVLTLTISAGQVPPKVSATMTVDAFQYVPAVPTVPGATSTTTTG